MRTRLGAAPRWRALTSLALALVSTVGCVVREQFTRPKLENDLGQLMDGIDVLPPFPEPLPASGSLWTDGGPGAALARDPRAFRTNDLVTVELEENVLGTNQSETGLNRLSEADVGAGVAFGLEDPNPQVGDFNLNTVLQSRSATTFAGDGTTTRASSLIANITTRVMRVLPNGDLVVAGQKTVMVNREHQVLTLVGSVRAIDVQSDNRVPSAAVGDLTVRLWGQGEIDATVRQGWFMRILNRVWPF